MSKRKLIQKNLFDNILSQDNTEDDIIDGDFIGLEDDGVDDPYRDTSNPISQPVRDDRPSEDSPEWQPYVMSHFMETELENGLPKLSGLRRVAKKLIGTLCEVNVHVVAAPEAHENGRATVLCQATFVYRDPDLGIINKSFAGSADAWRENIKWGGPYYKFPTAIAEARAEARCYRKALGLEVVSAEEVDGSASNDPRAITSEQILVIGNLCNKLNINVETLVKSKSKVESINKVSFEDAQGLCLLLNTFQQNKTGIPEGLVGYIKDWRSSQFGGGT